MLRNDKVIPIRGRGDVEAPIFCRCRLTDREEVVSLTRRLPFTPRKNPGTHFC
jgi:hypothetical protein